MYNLEYSSPTLEAKPIIGSQGDSELHPLPSPHSTYSTMLSPAIHLTATIPDAVPDAMDFPPLGYGMYSETDDMSSGSEPSFDMVGNIAEVPRMRIDGLDQPSSGIMLPLQHQINPLLSPISPPHLSPFESPPTMHLQTPDIKDPMMARYGSLTPNPPQFIGSYGEQQAIYLGQDHFREAAFKPTASPAQFSPETHHVQDYSSPEAASQQSPEAQPVVVPKQEPGTVSPRQRTQPKARKRRTSSGGAEKKCSGTASHEKKSQTMKSTHNAIEKRYRSNINKKLLALKDVVPSLRDASTSRSPKNDEDGDDCNFSSASWNSRINKGVILSAAADHIANLEKRIESFRAENMALREVRAMYSEGFNPAGMGYRTGPITINRAV